MNCDLKANEQHYVLVIVQKVVDRQGDDLSSL